jgi:ABC-type phosphate/phosphonate transport system substrate-binding protein
MSKVVCLKLEQGDFNQGFQVSVDIAEEGKPPYVLGLKGGLRQAPELPRLYQNWQTKYCNLEANYRRSRLHFTDEPGTKTTIAECAEAAEKLKSSMQNWLECEEFREVDRALRTNLNPAEQIRVILQTENEQLRKLPWEFWDFFQSFTHADLGISPTVAYAQKQLTLPRKIRILAILGSHDGIDIEADKKLLEKLPAAKVHFLVEPSHQEFSKLWEQSWDVLFFAGHSSSQDGEKGCIYINSTPEGRLEIDELEETLKKAIHNGLKLAIFNSCDGLGLANQLERLYIPQVIVMREPVPDEVAHDFLKSLLADLANGIPLYIAVRNTRNKLREIVRVEKKFPGAGWLPVICQNPTEGDFVWSSPKAKPWQFVYQGLKQHGLAVITGSAIALLLTQFPFTKSPCLKTEKWVNNACFKNLAKTSLTVGILTSPYEKLSPEAEQNYAIFLNKYLKEPLGTQIHDIQIEIGNDLSYRSVKDKIQRKDWDIVFAYSPMNSWEAQSHGYGWLARKGFESQGFYYSVLFTRPNSSIQSIADIKPTTKVALGSTGSASSFHVPIYTLARKRLTIVRTNSHSGVAELIKSGQAEVGASLAFGTTRPDWKIIHRSEKIPTGGVFISPKLSPDDQQQIYQTIQQAPAWIQKKVDIKITPEVNYEVMGKIARQVEELMNCGVDFFDDDPVLLACQPEGDISK